MPHVPLPDKLFEMEEPLIIGLTESPKRLENLRRSRLHAEDNNRHYDENDYLDLDKIEDEIKTARKLFTKQKWPVIDVTRKSVEETTAEIYALLQRHRGKMNMGNKKADNKDAREE